MFRLLYILVIFNNAPPASETVTWELSPLDLGSAKAGCLYDVNDVADDGSKPATWTTTVTMTATPDEVNGWSVAAVLRTTEGDFICRTNLLDYCGREVMSRGFICRCSGKNGNVYTLEVGDVFSSHYSGLGVTLSLEIDEVDGDEHVVKDFKLPEVKEIGATLSQDGGKSISLPMVLGIEVKQNERAKLKFCVNDQPEGIKLQITMDGRKVPQDAHKTVAQGVHITCVEATTKVMDFTKMAEHTVGLGFETPSSVELSDEECHLKKHYKFSIKENHCDDIQNESLSAPVHGDSTTSTPVHAGSLAPPQWSRCRLITSTVLPVLTLKFNIFCIAR